MLASNIRTSLAAARRVLAISSVCIVLQGCGNMQQQLRPTAPDRAVKTATEAAFQLRPAMAKGAPNFDDMKAVTSALRADIVGAAEQKNAQSWNGGLTSLIGGTLATIGSVTSRTGLTNTGIVLGLLGLSSEQFYKPVNAIDIHLDADSKLMCIEDATFGLSETERALAASSTRPGSDEARKAVDTVNGTLNSAMLSYRRSLLGIRPGTPTRDEILGFMKRFQADAQTAESGTRDVPPQEEAEQAAAAQKFIGLSTSLQACIKLGVPAVK